MLAQLSEDGGARSLATYGCSISCGEGPNELLGHIYMQKADGTLYQEILDIGAKVRACLASCVGVVVTLLHKPHSVASHSHILTFTQC